MAIIEVDRVSKKFRKYTNKEISTIKDLFVRGIFRKNTFETEIFWALRDISFAIPNGKMVGIIGSNGSGKSTLLKLLAGIMGPTTGNIRINGRISALIELGAGFHPELSGRENIFINGIILGLSKKEIQNRFDNIVKFAGLENFIDSPVKTYSSGMYMRLGFAIAINVDPDILLIDEILAVGDEEFQHKCLNKINEFKRRGKTLVFVSHDLNSVERLCDEAIWIEDGVLKESGLPAMVIDKYKAYVASFEENTAVRKHQTSPDKAELRSFGIFNDKNEKIINIVSEDIVKLAYEVKALKDLSDPHYGIIIRNNDGRSIFETNTYCMNIKNRPLNKGQCVRVIFELKCPLTPGDYSISVGIANKGYDKVYFEEYLLLVHNIETIKVLNNTETIIYGGVFNMQPRVEVKECF